MKRAIKLSFLFICTLLFLQSCGDQGVEVVITYNDTQPVKQTMEDLRGEGYKLIRRCMCGDKLKMHLWQAPPELDLDESVQKAKGQVGVDGVEMNIQMEIVLPDGIPAITELIKDEIDIQPQLQKDKIRVALIDTGVENFHKDLKPYEGLNQKELINGSDDDGNCLKDDRIGFDFLNNKPLPIDSFGHGTHIAGIISRDYPAEYALQIMDLKMHNGKNGDLFGAVCAMYYGMTKKARVMNLSWGFEGTPSNMLEQAIIKAMDNDILIVCSAGNDTLDLNSAMYWPACYDYDNMITVGALNAKNDKLAAFSNFGDKKVDIAAPGKMVKSTFPSDQYAKISGSSMSAGFVTRTAAVIRTADPGLTAKEVKEIIFNEADKLPGLNGKVENGRRLNHQEAVKKVNGPVN